MTMELLDDIFDVLEKATRLEETGVNRIEAATKVYVVILIVCLCVYCPTTHAIQRGQYSILLYSITKEFIL